MLVPFHVSASRFGGVHDVSVVEVHGLHTEEAHQYSSTGVLSPTDVLVSVSLDFVSEDSGVEKFASLCVACT